MGASQCAHGPGERMKISSAFGSSPNDAVAVVGETERSVPLFASGKDVVAHPNSAGLLDLDWSSRLKTKDFLLGLIKTQIGS